MCKKQTNYVPFWLQSKVLPKDENMDGYCPHGSSRAPCRRGTDPLTHEITTRRHEAPGTTILRYPRDAAAKQTLEFVEWAG